MKEGNILSPVPVHCAQLNVVEGVDLHQQSLLCVKMQPSHCKRLVKLEI